MIAGVQARSNVGGKLSSVKRAAVLEPQNAVIHIHCI
jgi:hypothetical protein